MKELFGFSALILSGLFGYSLCLAGELGDAVAALEKVRDMTEVGANYTDYGRAFPDMMAAIRKYSRSSGKNADVAKLMEKIGERYREARAVWDQELAEIELMRLKASDMEESVMKIDLETETEIRQRKIGLKLTPIWRKADKDLKLLLEVIEKKKLKW